MQFFSMELDLKYGEIYDLNINGKKYKGIYLGRTVPRKRLKLNYVFILNKGVEDLVNFPYCIIRFKKYNFKDNNLIPEKINCIIPPGNEREYLEKLLERID